MAPLAPPVPTPMRCDMLVIRSVMEPFGIVALLATMPLAFLEVFSSYAWICFTGVRYCDINTAESQLESDKDIVILFFFLCVSFLNIYRKMVKTPQKVKDKLQCLKHSKLLKKLCK